jgi:DNA-binding PadR family transcriptional regulator
MATRRTTKPANAADEERNKLYAEFLEFFYQVHYRLGMTLEAEMCNGMVSRTQAAVLWLVASEIGEGGLIRRKDVERRLGDWFETSNSNVSKLLRDLAKPPHKFIVQKENPNSGREKIIALTADGRAFVQSMKVRGIQYFETALAHMTVERMNDGQGFFEELFSQPVPQINTGKDRTTMRRSGSPIRRK